MWVFREGKKEISTARLVQELADLLRNVGAKDSDRTADALIRAGELESALTDCGSEAAVIAVSLTDALASAFVGDEHALDSAGSMAEKLAGQALPAHILISPPEGFAFYGLQPADFAASAATLATKAERFAVIGIRSIGTTLSALAGAALRQRGTMAERLTVRPTGHPFDRVTTFSPEQRRWIQNLQQQHAAFLVADEGPGMSGSSFLSVAEALEAEGVPVDRIQLLGSREPDVDVLCARDAARRWRRYQWQRAVPLVLEKYRDHTFWGAGVWRASYFPEEQWPACWTQMERLKFLSPQRDVFYKFEGLSRFGQEVRQRAEWLAEAGFSCPAVHVGDGVSAYRQVEGSPFLVEDFGPEVRHRLAEYCAFRRRHFPVIEGSEQKLAEMLSFNLEQDFQAPPPCELEWLIAEHPIVVDGRMHPHEWKRNSAGAIWKFDGCSHGDDHFFPGPTDIAWDLAGAIVEWKMDGSGADEFIRQYTALAGEDPRGRMPAYLLAYSTFRMSWCKMAAEAEQGAEVPRLNAAYRFYRGLVEKQLACVAAR